MDQVKEKTLEKVVLYLGQAILTLEKIGLNYKMELDLEVVKELMLLEHKEDQAQGNIHLKIELISRHQAIQWEQESPRGQ